MRFGLKAKERNYTTSSYPKSTTSISEISSSMPFEIKREESSSRRLDNAASSNMKSLPDSDARLRELGYNPQFKREMSFTAVIGISFWFVLK